MFIPPTALLIWLKLKRAKKNKISIWIQIVLLCIVYNLDARKHKYPRQTKPKWANIKYLY